MTGSLDSDHLASPLPNKSKHLNNKLILKINKVLKRSTLKYGDQKDIFITSLLCLRLKRHKRIASLWITFSQSPSLLIAGSGSWPQREGLLSPAARQIYRRNFPPVAFIQSWSVLTQIQLNCVFFAGYILIFVLSPVFKYKALVCILSSSIGVLY